MNASYVDYYHRLLDLDGRLRLASAAAWLRNQPDVDPAVAFEVRPASLRDPRHRLEGPACAPTLHFEARKPRPDAPAWSLPLAPPAHCAGLPAPAP
jgi:hypothetical protein